MIEKLIFGCGHLTGGASQASAHRLISMCLDAGVRRFDTAPLYGLGTAESALGLALRQDGREALINAKAGLPRPRLGILKSYLRATKRLVTHSQTPLGITPPQVSDNKLPRGRFDPEKLEQSLMETLHELGVPSVETLFLHEAHADDLTSDVVAFLHHAQGRGLARYLGIANGAVYEPALMRLMPLQFIMQFAVPPSLFASDHKEPSDRLVFHTIINSFFSRRAADAAFDVAVETSYRRFKSLLGEQPGAAVALAYLMLAAAAPAAMLIYTTTAPARLMAFLSAISVVAREKARDEIVEFTSKMYRTEGSRARSS